MADRRKGRKQDGDTQGYSASFSQFSHRTLSRFICISFRARDIKTNFITLITLFTFGQMATSTSYIKQEASAGEKDTPSKAEVEKGTQKY